MKSSSPEQTQSISVQTSMAYTRADELKVPFWLRYLYKTVQETRPAIDHPQRDSKLKSYKPSPSATYEETSKSHFSKLDFLCYLGYLDQHPRLVNIQDVYLFEAKRTVHSQINLIVFTAYFFKKYLVGYMQFPSVLFGMTVKTQPMPSVPIIFLRAFRFSILFSVTHALFTKSIEAPIFEKYDLT